MRPIVEADIFTSDANCSRFANRRGARLWKYDVGLSVAPAIVQSQHQMSDYGRDWVLLVEQIPVSLFASQNYDQLISFNRCLIMFPTETQSCQSDHS